MHECGQPVCTYINHILVSLNKEIATYFLQIKQLFVPSVHVVRPKIKKTIQSTCAFAIASSTLANHLIF